MLKGIFEWHVQKNKWLKLAIFKQIKITHVTLYKAVDNKKQ